MRRYWGNAREWSHRHAAWACVAFAIALSWYLWSPLLGAGWLLIDDHEIVALTGAQNNFGYGDIPAALAKSEVGSSSVQTRFRPAYFVIRYTEAATWGDHPRAWYAIRVAIAMLSAAVLAYLSVRIAGPLVGTAAAAFLLTRPFWADLFARLGPAETYALFGLDLIAIAWFIWRSRPRSVLPVVLVTIGSLIAIGCKENFLILAPFIAVFLWRYRGRETGLTTQILLRLVLLYSGWIAYVVLMRIWAAGHDVYQQDISARARLDLAQGFLARWDVQIWLLLILIGIVAAGIANLFRREEALAGVHLRLKWAVAAGVVLLALYGSQYVYYFGKWPEATQGRYLIPGVLLKYFAALLACAALHEFVKATLGKGWLAWGVPAVVMSCMVALTAAGWDQNRTTAKVTRHNSQRLAANFQKVYDYLREHPDAPLIMKSHHANDYEPIFAVERFVRAQGLKNPIAIDHTPRPTYDDPLLVSLGKFIEGVSREGSKDFMALSSARRLEQCFSLGLSGPRDPACQGLDLKW